jgi:hypothetical protein
MNALKAITSNGWLRIQAAMTVAVLLSVAYAWTNDAMAWDDWVLAVGGLAVNGMIALEMHLRQNSAARDVESQSRAQQSTINPPFIAEWLVALLIAKRRSEGLLGDLQERFHRHIQARGLRRARALYWAEVLQSILPILWAKARSLGLIAAIAEIWRRAHS